MIICGRSKNPFLSECAANIILEFTGSDSRFIGHFKAIAVLSDTAVAVVGVSSKTVSVSSYTVSPGVLSNTVVWDSRVVKMIGVSSNNVGWDSRVVNVKGPSIVEPIAVLSDTLRRSEGDRLVSSDTAIAVLSDTATVLSDTPFDLTLLAAGVSSNTVIVKVSVGVFSNNVDWDSRVVKMIGVSSDTLRQ
ncbi:hypothetical protein DPMN_157036 [Dreissena polymorpha]|uniref:Uncharacterized protein n=1 Tax=Dreissena polymorpha TaxID=45954 RepID=A0A9D4EGC7_DREPO|nr:hypothetical protein DPMN_157036 [Dreissena polymorpha]